MMANETLFREIEGYLSQEASKTREELLLDSAVLLALLVKRRCTLRTREFAVKPGDPDAGRLKEYLLSPALAPGLATARVKRTWLGKEVVAFAPNWDRLAGFYGKTMPEFKELLEKTGPRLVERHWATFHYLLKNE
jgi:hypothetical protein